MSALYLILTLAAALALVDADGSTTAPCGNGAYTPAFESCTNGHVCGLGAPCSCNPAVAGGTAGCYTVERRSECPTQPGGATCPGSSNGDPLVQGFDGCSWYLEGKPDTVMNLVSEATHSVNTLLVPAGLTDPHHANGEGTFHGAISMRHKDAVVTASVTPEGNLTVLLGAKPVPFGEAREQSGLTVKVTEYYKWYGQVAEIVTPAFRFFIHAVQPYDTPAGWSRGHLDFSMTVSAADVTMHGLLGQTINSAGALCPGDFEFHGEGIEADYVMPHLDSVDFTYSAFIGQTASVSRRLQAANSVYVPAAVTKTASSGALLGL